MNLDFQLLSPLVFTIFSVGFFSINAVRPSYPALVIATSYLVGALTFLSDILLQNSDLIVTRTGVASLYALTAIIFSGGLWTYYRGTAPWRLMLVLWTVHVAIYAWLMHIEFNWMRSFAANFGCAVLFSIGLLAFRGRMNRPLDKAIFVIHLVNCVLCFIRPLVLAGMVEGALSNANHSEMLFVMTLHFFVATGAVVTAMALLILFSKDLIEELETRSMTDALTGLLNRRGFETRVTRMLETADDREICAIIGDIDHFKSVNDTFGHVMGDQVITRVGQLFGQMEGHCRYCARLGGEEFVFVGDGLSLAEAIALADRVRSDIETLLLTSGGEQFHCTASFGVALRQPGESLADLLSRADAALYLSKEAGRNRVYSETDMSVSWLREAFEIMDRRLQNGKRILVNA